MSSSSGIKRSSHAAGFSLYDEDSDTQSSDPHISQFATASKKSALIAIKAHDTSYPNDSKKIQLKNQTFITACGWRKGERDEMQDRHVVEELFNVGAKADDIRRSAFFALFDGHAGSAAAEFCAKHFVGRVSANCAKQVSPEGSLNPVEKSMKKIFTDSYKTIDDEFLNEAKKRRPTLKDGSTATTIILLNEVLYCANIGDSRAVVCRLKTGLKDAIAMQLTTDHMPIAFNERMRIQKAGGMVKDGRVMGVLEVSRSIGDGQFKAHGVSCIPDIKKLTLTPEDLFIILACDGLWKTFSSDEAVNFALSRYEFLRSNPEFLAKVARNAAANSSGNNSSEVNSNCWQNSAREKQIAIWAKVADELCAAAILRACGDNVSVILVVFVEQVERRLDLNISNNKSYSTNDCVL